MDEDLQLPNLRTVRMTLIDLGDGDGKQQVKLVASPLAATVYADGYGVKSIRDRTGVVICIRLYNGELAVLIWSDINQQEPTHVISLENARVLDI